MGTGPQGEPPVQDHTLVPMAPYETIHGKQGKITMLHGAMAILPARRPSMGMGDRRASARPSEPLEQGRAALVPMPPNLQTP